MRTRIGLRRFRRVALTLLVSVACCLFANAAYADVTATPCPEPTIEPFDTRPPDMKPGEDADDGFDITPPTASIGIEPRPGGKVRIASVSDVSLSGHSVIRIPRAENNPRSKLLKHERGHAALDCYEWTRDAARKMRNALRTLVGPTEYPSEDAAQAELNRRLNDWQESVQKQVNTINQKYDKLTNHGKDDKGFDSESGKKEAIKERNKPPFPWNPPPGFFDDLLRPYAGLTSSSAFFDPGADTLRLVPDPSHAMSFDFARDPLDTLLESAVLRIEPMVLIGLDSSGAIELSDTALQIVDTADGSLLMDAFLYNVSYLPLSGPDHAGLLQAYLDIPPLAVDGIHNTIGSNFLTGMQTASDRGLFPAFSFFADRPLFDDLGMSLIGAGGVTGRTELSAGALAPEPPILPLLVCGLIAGAALKRVRNRERS